MQPWGPHSSGQCRRCLAGQPWLGPHLALRRSGCGMARRLEARASAGPPGHQGGAGRVEAA
eukprot:6847342-Alexandrium_andersonii.AAC.1